MLHIGINIVWCVPKYFPRKTNTLVGPLRRMILPAVRKVQCVLYGAIEISSSSSSSRKVHFRAEFSHDVLGQKFSRKLPIHDCAQVFPGFVSDDFYM